MLAFFRKYEKTFLLVIFAPALISLGITGVMMDAISGDPGNEVAGRVFGEEVTGREFQSFKQLYASGNQGAADDEQVWRFWALLRAAEQAGIEVSDQELGEEIREKFRWRIAQYKAQKKIEAEGLDPFRDEEARQRWQMEVFNQLSQGTAEFDQETYQQMIAEQTGMGTRRYEELERREAKVMRLMDSIREMGVVSVDDIWEQFQEEHHLRVAEVLAVPASEFVPDLAVTDSNSKAFVSPAQVKAHYQANLADYDEPRRVDAEYVAADLGALKLAVKGDEIGAYYEANKHEFVAPVESGQPVYKELDAVRGEIEDRLALERADAAMDMVATRVAEARKGEQGVDLKAVAEAVSQATGTPLLHGTTGFQSREDLSGHEVLAGFAAGSWLDRVDDTEDVTDVLAGEKAWFVLRAKGIRPARTPRWEEVEARAREEYARGSKAERRRWYETHRGELQQPERLDVELVTALDEQFGGDHQKAKEVLEKVLEEAKKLEPGFRLSRLEGMPAVEGSIGLRTDKVEKTGIAELKQHPALGKEATSIALGVKGELSRAQERFDGKGWVAWRIAQKHAPTVPTLDEVQEEVAEKVAAGRALTRAEDWVRQELLPQLRHKTGDALAKTLAELKLEPKRTAPFARTATTIEGWPEAGRIVAEAFSSLTEVGGPYGEPLRDEKGQQVLLVRVAEQKDAPEAEFQKQYDALRRDLVRTERNELGGRVVSKILLKAKGIPEAHRDYARQLRDGPEGQVSLQVRQIYLPPDRDIIEGWLKQKARERIEEARQKLAGGASWNAVVSEYSEDEHSRQRGGQLAPVRPGDLRGLYGENLEQRVWDLAQVDPNAPVTTPPEPIESTQGLHLVQRIDGRDQQAVFRHLLIKTDAEARQLPEEVRKQADEASRAAIEQAWARLQAGEPFEAVADQVGDTLDPLARGEELSLDWTTPFERAALDQPVDWELGEDQEGQDPTWTPEPVEVAGPGGQAGWHWFACERERFARDRVRGGGRGDRAVYHITGTKEAVERARAQMKTWLAEQLEEEDGDRPGFPTILRRFQELARERSGAPDAPKGGAFGLLRLGSGSAAHADAVRPYGDEFLRRITLTPEGKPTSAGYRTGPFRSASGWHLVEVTEVTTKPAQDPERATEVADLLLAGTDWQ